MTNRPTIKRAEKRKCAACGRPCGTLSRPGAVFDEPIYVEGYPLGRWGRVDAGRQVCAAHSMQTESEARK